MSSWKELQKDVERFEMPDIAGLDGGTIQLILIVIIALWLFRKLKGLFFMFMLAVIIYYYLQLG